MINNSNFLVDGIGPPPTVRASRGGQRRTDKARVRWMLRSAWIAGGKAELSRCSYSDGLGSIPWEEVDVPAT